MAEKSRRGTKWKLVTGGSFFLSDTITICFCVCLFCFSSIRALLIILRASSVRLLQSTHPYNCMKIKYSAAAKERHISMYMCVKGYFSVACLTSVPYSASFYVSLGDFENPKYIWRISIVISMSFGHGKVFLSVSGKGNVHMFLCLTCLIDVVSHVWWMLSSKI